MSARAWAMSSPPVRMLAVPQADSATCRGPGAVASAGTARRPARPSASPAARPPASARRGSRPSRSCGRSAAPRAGRGSARRSGRAPRAGRRARASRPCELGRAAGCHAPGRRRSSIRRSTARGRRPAGLGRAPRRRPAAGQQLQPLDRVALRSATGRGRASSARGRGPAHGSPSVGAERVPAEPEIGRQGAQQRGVAALAATARQRAPAPPADRSAARPRASGRRRAGRRGSAAP